ncbi:MAG TPA: hypothetical protein VN154_13610 [Rhizomicrobium sp.]|nr:hypothetical protein [Rhizomicrobium sp.]
MRTIALALTFVAAAATQAFAQDQQPATQGTGPGMFKQACGADVEKYCASAKSRDERRSCIVANKENFSDSCKAFLATHHKHLGEGQMQGGQGQ